MRQAKKYVLFDMAGTIVSSRIDWERENLAGAMRLAKYFDRSGIKIIKPDEFIGDVLMQARLGRTQAKEERVEYSLERVIVNELKRRGIEMNKTMAKMALCEYIKPELDLTFLYKGVVSLLDGLKKQNCELFLVSNTPTKEFVEMTIDKYGLKKYFSYVLTSYEVGYRKPHELFLRHLIEHGRPDLKNSVFVGDRLKDDIESAKRLGIKGIFFNKVEHPDNEKYRQEIIPEAEVDNFTDLYQAIMKALNIKETEIVKTIS